MCKIFSQRVLDIFQFWRVCITWNYSDLSLLFFCFDPYLSLNLITIQAYLSTLPGTKAQPLRVTPLTSSIKVRPTSTEYIYIMCVDCFTPAFFCILLSAPWYLLTNSIFITWLYSDIYILYIHTDNLIVRSFSIHETEIMNVFVN